jgi:hypothetical protein
MRRRSVVSAETDSDRPDETSGPPDGWARARWRLRDLRGRDRLLALGMLVLLLVPFVVALVRAFRDGWVPSGDEANIAIRSLDVFTRHPPLTGLPSTSALYGDKISTYHPGPIEFYLLALPLRVLGLSVGPLLTAATINCGCLLIAVWVFFRRLGLVAMLWAGVLLLAVMWSGGTAVLTDTLSSNMTMYSLLCTAVLAWALIDGDLRLLPLAALVASYAAQQHLAAGLIVAALVVVAIVALAVQIVMRVRRGDEAVKRVALWASLAAAIAGVSWAPAIADEIGGHPGNLTAIVRFARDNTRPTLGFKSGFYQALHAVTPPTVLGRTDTTGSFFTNAPGLARIVLCVLVVAGLAVVALATRVRSPGVARLAFVAFVLLVAGAVDGSNVPMGFESVRVNLYRWTWAAAFVTWAALGAGVVLLAARAVARSSIAPRVSQLGPPALLVVAALIATSIVFVHGRDDHNRELPEFALEKRVAAAVLARVDRRHPVIVSGTGSDAFLSVAPYLILRLVDAGVTVEVPSLLNSTYGSSRIYRRSLHPPSISVTSGKAGLPSARGELIEIEPFGPKPAPAFEALFKERTALLDHLSAAALGAKVELAPGAKALIDREYSAAERHAINLHLVFLSSDPRVAFKDPVFLKLVSRGILRSPVLDQTEVRRLLDLPAYRYTGAWGDEQIAVYLLTSAQTEFCLTRPCFRP